MVGQPRHRRVPDDRRQRSAPRSAARLAGAGIHDRDDAADMRALRRRAGAAPRAYGTGDVIKSGGRGLTARPEGSAFQRLPGRDPDCGLARPRGRRAALREELPEALSVDVGFRQDGILVRLLRFSPRNLAPEALPAAKTAILESYPRLAAGERRRKRPRRFPSRRQLDDGRRHGGADGEGRLEQVSWVSPGFFQALDVPVLAGRDFAAADTASSARVMLVNETFVRRYLQDRAGDWHAPPNRSGAGISGDGLRDRRHRPRHQVRGRS